MMLKEVEVSRRNSPLGAVADSLGGLSISGRDLRRGIHVLGEADAVRSLASLPGYESPSDYGSGIVVGGNDYAVTAYSADGAQIFYPFHFAGIFSTFSPNYFASVRVTPPAASVSAPFMLGANIDARTASSMPSGVRGVASVGMLASGVSLAAPLAHRRLALRGAVRSAHLPASRFDDTELSYRFTDADFSARYEFSDSLALSLCSAYNSDNLKFSAVDNILDSRLKWKNFSNSLSLTGSSPGAVYSLSAFFSHYESALSSLLSPVSLELDSHIDKLALAGEISLTPNSWEAGFRIEHSCLRPMRPRMHGMVWEGAAMAEVEDALFSVGVAKSWRIGGAGLRTSVRGAYYTAQGTSHMAFDPQVALSFSGAGLWRVTIGHYSQFQHLVGLSDFGFASNFWLPSGSALSPQRQWGVDVAYSSWVASDISISVKGFAKRVVNSAQYLGSVLDVIDIAYDPFRSVVATDGYNVGGDAVLAFDCGALSGFGGYSLALCRRRDPYYGRWTSSATEPLHSAKASLSYRPSQRLCISAFFTLSSGRPYTPVNAIYIIAGNIITDYGVLNSARLPLYHRLDLSATYTFGDIRLGSVRMRNFANFSLINSLGHRNVEMQYFKYHPSRQEVSLTQVASVYRFLPSISYTVEF